MTRPTVLLVDDVEANLIALEAQLGSLDCDLVRASSGNDGLRELLKREFAVMLLDVQMPGMDGYEVASYARDNPATREVPIIFVTAMLEAEDTALRGYGTGAVDFLFKPVNPYILRSKVQVFLDLYTSRRKLADTVAAHERTLKDLEAFNYSVSHDLRAPLRPLDGFSQTLLEDYGAQLDDKARGYLLRIRNAAQRMAQLIDDLLRLSRLRGVEIRPRAFCLSDLVSTILAELRASDPERNVEILVQPAVDVYADPGLVRIALENLLRNAWKFTSKKGNARIEFGQLESVLPSLPPLPGGPVASSPPASSLPSLAESSRQLTCFVRDDGVGFDLAHAARLAQPFQRFHTANQFEGTGIGLAIVELVLRHHQSRLWAESQPDCGATFFFTLQRSPEPARHAG
jgi:two-component system sensor histidine kinase/response regulator